MGKAVLVHYFYSFAYAISDNFSFAVLTPVLL